MRNWWREFSELVLPAFCGGCDRAGTELCRACARALYGDGARRAGPVPEPPGLPPVYAAAPYQGAVRALLLAHKERGALPLAPFLGAALAGAVGAALEHHGGAPADRPVLLVPVPSAPRAVRARGQDAARRLARAAAAELRRAGVAARALPVLRQRREVADQAGLTAPLRRANLAGALAVADGGGRLLAAGRPVLVDDLVTTGASLAEAARAVRAAVTGDGDGGGAGQGESGRAGPGARRVPVVAAVVAAPAGALVINRN
ncbi:ComF family protein [Streptomyces sp. LP05-1]|uniref:ComF family protein n=1 Tax=Streptomyces pyxinae TaxID=2970734 RepID=A0ABT2CF56_9ACTN|nr:ComF family protein [Streptomyces sp. LP05-1]MCS0636035.1 ComF family protein [Streptomyces sp. LP05-1]